jgi:hypothetical protein
MLEYDDEAERGRGDVVPVGMLTGREASELVDGWKSKRGDNSGATPY